MRIRRNLVLTICVAALAAATAFAQTATAQGSKSSGPTLIKDTENPARSAVQSACTFDWTNFSGQNGCDLMDVPTGKRVIVEHASGICFTQGADLIFNPYIETNLAAGPQTTIGTYLSFTTQATTSDGHWSLVSQSIRAYGDPGSTVRVKAYLIGDPTDSGQTCYFSISGHLVDVQ